MLESVPWSFMLGVVTVLLAPAAPAEDYQMPIHAIGSGGGASAGEDVGLHCTVGQAIAGSSAGGDYMLLGGYWGGATRMAVLGDCDGNRSAQLSDFACFANCFTGAGREVLPECTLFDLDSDHDVDGNDFAIFVVQLGG